MNSKIVGRSLARGREWGTDKQRKSLQIKIDELERIGTRRKTVFLYLFALLCMVLEEAYEEKQRILGLGSGPWRPEQGS